MAHSALPVNIYDRTSHPETTTSFRPQPMTQPTDEPTSDYLVTPEFGDGPGVLLLHSGRGRTESLFELGHRLARDGFVTLIPDLFDGRTAATVEQSRALKRELDAGNVIARLEDAAEFLRQHPAVSRRRIGVVGLGYGAEWASTVAPRIEDVCGGIVLFYGLADTDWNALEAPILGHFAELDREIPGSRVNELRTTLSECGVEHDLFVYPQTEPSFFETDESARFDPDAATLAWERTVRFLDDRLKRR